MNKNITQLIEMLTKHPDREVIAMVDEEIVGNEGYSRWMAELGEARIDEYYYADGRIYFKSTDLDELKEDYIDIVCLDYEDGEISDEELDRMGEEYVESIEWKKVIVINVDGY